jgi:hypothetical protein
MAGVGVVVCVVERCWLRARGRKWVLRIETDSWSWMVDITVVYDCDIMQVWYLCRIMYYRIMLRLRIGGLG